MPLLSPEAVTFECGHREEGGACATSCAGEGFHLSCVSFPFLPDSSPTNVPQLLFH